MKAGRDDLASLLVLESLVSMLMLMRLSTGISSLLLLLLPVLQSSFYALEFRLLLADLLLPRLALFSLAILKRIYLAVSSTLLDGVKKRAVSETTYHIVDKRTVTVNEIGYE